jgi:hypothetical protein
MRDTDVTRRTCLGVNILFSCDPTALAEGIKVEQVVAPLIANLPDN